MFKLKSWQNGVVCMNNSGLDTGWIIKIVLDEINCQWFHVKRPRYARIQAIGITLRPPSEKNHNFQKNASILVNKVTFVSWNICPHDKTNLKVHKYILGYFEVIFFGHFLPIFCLFLCSTKSIGPLLAFINICHVCFIICAFTYCKIYILLIF